jgi:uncharacterized protein
MSMAVSFALEKGLGTIMGTLRSFLLASVWAVALSGSGTAQVRTNTDMAVSAGLAAYVRADYPEAVRWFRLAAGQGNAFAQYSLGFMYDNGEGVPENDAEAVRWYRLAADQGDADAQLNLGVMYDDGEGVPENNAEAVRWYRLAADQGDADAQLNLGVMYDDGEGVPENNAEAVRWYRLAADQGDATAQFNLGVKYDNGEGVPQNYPEAVRLYRSAAEQGHARAQFNLGVKYDNGEGVPQNYAEAGRWYRLAADQGDAKAQSNLGVMYANGRGVVENDVEAVKWYRFAAEQGQSNAQHNLGLMYANGTGVTQNYVEAYKWWALAAAQDNAGAAKNRDVVLGKMTAAQIAEGQRLAAEWEPRTSAIAAAPSAAPEKSSAAGDIEGTGSGFFVTAAGHVLTNAHVVEGCTRISLAGASTLTVLDIDASSDLALLKKGGTSVITSLMLRQGRGVRLADNVVVAGFPLSGLLSSGLNVTTGAVSALAGPGDDRRLIQITAPVQPGNSGGPLLDSSGNVVGVVVSKLDALEVASITGDIPQNVNFAISLGTLQAFLDSNSIDYQTRPSSSPKSNADVAEMARAATVQIECRN